MAQQRTTYAVVQVTDHRTDPPREFEGLIRWASDRQRRTAVAAYAAQCFSSGPTSAGPQFEIQWGRSVFAPAQVFIADQFAADVVLRRESQQGWEALQQLLDAPAPEDETSPVGDYPGEVWEVEGEPVLADGSYLTASAPYFSEGTQ